MADQGFTIEPVKVVYPHDIEFGRDITCPYYFQKDISVGAEESGRMLGEDLTLDNVVADLEKIGHIVRKEGDTVMLTPPEYRNDFLHAVDVIEEIISL